MAKEQEVIEEKNVSVEAKEKKGKKKKVKKEKKPSYLKEFRLEMKKVTFPSFKSVMKYTLATLLFCGFVVVFFLVLNLLLSVVKGMF